MSQIAPVVPRMEPLPLPITETPVSPSAGTLVKRISVAAQDVAEKSTTFSLSSDIYQNIWMGAVSGMVGLSAVYPMDITKTKVQNYRGPPPAPSVPAVIRGILQAEGFRGLYKGLPPQLAGAGPEKAVTLASRDFFRHVLGNEQSQATYILSGMGAGSVQSMVVNPIEAIKVRIQLTEGKGDILRTIREIGIRRLYTGYSACYPRDVAFAGLYFTLYENAKLAFKVRPEDASAKGIALKMAAGVVSGIPAAFLTTPLDVIKTRLQAPNRGPGEGLVWTARALYRMEGIRGLFRGWVPRVGRIAPQYAIVLMVYEWLHQMVQGDRH